ncbi:MAG TPA: hypothetical protein VJO12_04385 [Stellaceae bacterium]|nr:hypothetical protein [Stellaceae bacterium]
MRLVLVIAFCVIAAWGVSSFLTSDKPPAAAPVVQNGDPQKLEQDMVKAAGWLETSPCDAKYRASLRQAIIAYANVARAARLPVDQAASDVVRGAVIAGIVHSDEIGVKPVAEVSVIQNGSQRTIIVHHSPYTCRADGGDTRQSQDRPDLPENAGR